MTAKDLIALIYKTQHPKSTEAAPPAFLTVDINTKEGGPPTRLADNQLLSPLFQETHTMSFQLVKLPTEPTPTKSKSPAKAAAPKTATAKNAPPAKKPATTKTTAAAKKTSPAKKGRGNK
jgi:hypothetical protein